MDVKSEFSDFIADKSDFFDCFLNKALSAESMYTLTPAFYDVVLKTKAARDEDSAAMLDLIFTFENEAKRAIAAGVEIEDVISLPVHERIGRAKSADGESYKQEFDAILAEIRTQINGLIESAKGEAI